MLKRREFITLLGGAAAVPLIRPLAARAQQPMPVIGLLMAVPFVRARVVKFTQGLAEAGFVEGRNLRIERRSAEGHYERLPALAAELVNRRVAAIAAGTPVAALAAKAATRTIPIVFVLGSDPVKDGLVASLNRPGGNVTGVTFFSNVLAAKRFEVLHDIAPNAGAVGLLLNPDNANAEFESNETQEAARALGLRLLVVRAIKPAEIEAAFAELARQQVTALVVGGDAYLTNRREQIVALAMRHRIATCFPNRFGVEAGGLLGYGADRADADHQFGLYIARVLKGEKPADLPVVQPTKFELILNLKTAKALKLDIPPKVLALADEVIE